MARYHKKHAKERRVVINTQQQGKLLLLPLSLENKAEVDGG